MSVEENKAVVRRLYDEVNKGNLAVLDELIAPDFVNHGDTTFRSTQGLDAFRQALRATLAGMPDIRWVLDEPLAEGDRVAVRGTIRGTHTAPLFGIPPTGKRVTWTGIEIYRVVGGKLAERWHSSDDLGLMQQLGVVPPPQQERAAA